MTRRCSFACWVLFSALCAACGSDSSGEDDPQSGGQTGEENLGCLPVETTPLAWSQRSPLGFSADEVLAALGSSNETRLTWPDGTSTALSIGLERVDAGQVEYQVREWMSDGAGNSEQATSTIGGPECNDVVAIPARLSFSTNDGAFAEQWALTLYAESATLLRATVNFNPRMLTGDYVLSGVDPDDYDDVQAHIDLQLEEEGWTGTISGQASRSDADPDGTSSAQNFQIASF